MSRPLHLARRFFGALAPGGPSEADEAWVGSLLSEAELALWRRMSGADRRHAAGVARRVGVTHTERAVLVAALLHDVGKVESGLDTFERVPATLARPFAERAPVPERWRRYYRHPELGAELLELAGSDPLVVAWAREHHSPPAKWTVPADVGTALKSADDD
jgi:putative nucleotidyltransferase with HDIG domain